jgi:hypothetical protein
MLELRGCVTAGSNLTGDRRTTNQGVRRARAAVEPRTVGLATTSGHRVPATTTEGEQMSLTTPASPAAAAAQAPAIRAFSVALAGEQTHGVRARVGSTRRAEREPGEDRTEPSLSDDV